MNSKSFKMAKLILRSHWLSSSIMSLRDHALNLKTECVQQYTWDLVLGARREGNSPIWISKNTLLLGLVFLDSVILKSTILAVFSGSQTSALWLQTFTEAHEWSAKWQHQLENAENYFWSTSWLAWTLFSRCHQFPWHVILRMHRIWISCSFFLNMSLAPANLGLTTRDCDRLLDRLEK